MRLPSTSQQEYWAGWRQLSFWSWRLRWRRSSRGSFKELLPFSAWAVRDWHRASDPAEIYLWRGRWLLHDAPLCAAGRRGRPQRVARGKRDRDSRRGGGNRDHHFQRHARLRPCHHLIYFVGGLHHDGQPEASKHRRFRQRFLAQRRRSSAILASHGHLGNPGLAAVDGMHLPAHRDTPWARRSRRFLPSYV